MFRFILKRVASMPLLLLGVVTLAFVISRLLPADPIASIVGQRNLGNEEIVAAAEAKWGLDQPLPTQYLTYIGNLLTGDLGTSFQTKMPVSSDIAERLPATLELTLMALIIGAIGGILLGVISASRKNRAPDHVSRVFALIGSSLPIFWTGLVLLFVFYAQLGILPGPGRLSSRVIPPADVTGFYTIDALLQGDMPLFWDAFGHLLLPAFIMGWGLMGTISRLVRASMLDELGSDYVRTIRAKGVSESQLMRGHVLRNSLTPVVTILGFAFGAMLMGAVLVETIFSWNGIGSYAVEATRSLDYPAINAVCLLGGAVFLIANLVTDIAYPAIDPRVRLS
ncbi:ABC transporter permease [Demequina silvatica]|uniref:ABC transporter permease n=1 Tax=Demequina silvatica TaxID=1638988 RepID=UPI000780FF73|nr:ABC transporter permease [Demequina silvatica]